MLFALLLWIRREGNRSRIYFSVAYAVCGIDLFIRIFRLYNGTPFSYESLNPAAFYMALLEMPLFLFYLLEVISPGWLTGRKIILLCSPWLLWNVCLPIPGLHFRELDTFKDVFLHIGETDVWLRLLFVLLMLPYSALIFKYFLSLKTEQRLFELDKALRNRIYRPGTALHRLFRKRFDAVEQPAFVLWDGLLLLYRLL